MRAPLRVRSQSSRPSPGQLCSPASARRHLHFLGAGASCTLNLIKPPDLRLEGAVGKKPRLRNRHSRWRSRFGGVHPPFFLYLFILRNFKSFNFATADCKALSDRNLTSAHSKGLADFNGRQTAASPSAAPIKNRIIPRFTLPCCVFFVFSDPETSTTDGIRLSRE